jgi:trk system potassium uptake protein TrkH
MIYSNILHALGWLILVIAVAMAVPLVFAFASADAKAFSAFSLSFLFTLFSAGGLIMAFRGTEASLTKRDLLPFIAAGWAAMSFFGALPFFTIHPDASFTGAVFESVSGITTTGATVFETLDDKSRALILWRAILQWLGGWGSVFLGAAVFASFGIGGMSLRLSPLTRGETTNPLQRLRSTATEIGRIYTTLTLVGLLVIWASGVPAFDAVCLTLSAVSTGGFVPTDAGLSAYEGVAPKFWLMVLMCLGAISFATHRQVVRTGLRAVREDPEVLYFFNLVLAATLVIWVVTLIQAPGHGDILSTLFAVISLVTTTGWLPHEAAWIERTSPVFLLGLAVIGGSTLSTAGGLKLLRAGLLIKQSSKELQRLVYPHGIIQSRFGDRTFGIQLMKSVWAFFVVFVTALGVGGIVFAALGIDMEPAFAASLSLLANVGPAYDMARLAGMEGPSIHDFSTLAKWWGIVIMLAGRLELVLLLALTNRTFWRG